ncbi:MAG: hypothetical protein BAJALOKI1v1_580009 [Promethearchaeota archaeon]|nr:MAG: hypothetical protein BAJALOKI1v1_580009 [Candidatus Lokiarchaeota archaeon]
MSRIKLSEEMKDNIKARLNYSEEDLEVFLKNPKNVDVLSKSLKLLAKTIEIEVIASHGCNSQHKVGDKFYFDGAGNLITKLSPKKICIFALAELDKLIFAATELIYAGADPNQIRFNKASCTDIGLKCGGWGQIVMKMKVVDRK